MRSPPRYVPPSHSFGVVAPAVENAEEVHESEGTITAVLDLEGVDRFAKLRLSLVGPRRITVKLHHPNPTAHTTVAFEDEGQHYYGVWEHAHGGGLDLRGVEHGLVGRDYQHDQVYAASIRAPFYMTSNGLGVYAETQASGHYYEEELEQDLEAALEAAEK